MNYKYILWISLILLVNLKVFSQSNQGGHITGVIIENDTHKPVQFANIGLFTTKDSSMFKGTMTDENGQFYFEAITANNYYIQVSCLGFESLILPNVVLTQSSKNEDLGTRYLSVSSIVLSDVSVATNKSMHNNSIDRKVFNVDQDILSQTGSVSDILQNIPSLSVDIDGTVALRGSSNVTFFINGKPSTLINKNSAMVLQQIPSNTIERIEVITNPSAKYKPDGVGGIINIVLKKERQKGVNGMLLANAGNSDRYNAGVSLNYNSGKINVFGNYGLKLNSKPRLSTDYRINRDLLSNVVNYYNSESNSNSKPFSQLGTVGFDYQMNDNNKFELSANANLQDKQTIKNTHSDWKNPEYTITNSYTTHRDNDETEVEWEASALWEHQFNKEDHVVQFELNLSGYDETEDNYYTEKHRIPTVYEDISRVLIKKNGPQAEFYAEYTLPISEDTEFESGYVFESFKDNLTYLGKDYDKKQELWIKDVNKSNEFISKQQVHAIYATFSHAFDRLSFMAGLRAEQAYIHSKLLTLDSVVPNNYFKLYPTIHLAYELSDNQELQLNYSKRVKRADSDEMNPFPEYSDPRNMEAGNPLVKPEQIHSIELGYHLKTKTISILPSIYYRYKYDGFAEIKKYVNDSVLLKTFTNLSKSEFMGLELILSAHIGEIANLNFSANGYYSKLNASNIGYSSNKSAFSWDSKLGANINLTKSTLFQVNSFYRSKRINAQGTTEPVFYANMGVRQDIWKNKASLIVTISDVFNTLNKEYYIDTPELWQKSTRKKDSQIVHFGFTYRFGTSTKREKQELKYDDSI